MMKRWAPHALVGKVAMLVVLVLLATIPLSMIDSLVGERGAMRSSAATELASSYAGPQTLAGPLLVVPYTERWVEITRNDKGRETARMPRSRAHVKLLFPQSLDVRGELAPDQRYRGVFTVLFYRLQATISGRFAPFDPASVKGDIEGSTIEFGTPLVALGMSDVRGLQGAPRLQVNGEAADFAPRVPGIEEALWLYRGVHAVVPPAAAAAWGQHQPLEFQLGIAVVGQSRIGIVPLGDQTTAHLASKWPHPAFGGTFLAANRVVQPGGFSADWAVASLATSARAQLATLGTKDEGRVDTFDVALIEPLDVYALTGRAVKYGLLFVGLTLMAAFMFEVMRRLPLHPVQYGLVGVAITLFFLLLLALSEKIAFGLAYLIATGATVTLLTVYFSAVLASVRRGLSLGGYVALLYAALYGLLLSQDNALLLGAVLLFALVALLMVATRKVDWYALTPPRAPAPAVQSP